MLSLSDSIAFGFLCFVLGELTGTVEIAPGESEVLAHSYAEDLRAAWQSSISYQCDLKSDPKATKPGFVSKRQVKRDAAARSNRLAAVFSTVNVEESELGEGLGGGTSFCVKQGRPPAKAGPTKKVVSKRPSRPHEDSGGLLHGMSAEERELNGLPPAHIPAKSSGAHPPTPGKKVIKRPSTAVPVHATAAVVSVPVATAVVAGDSSAAHPRKVVKRPSAAASSGDSGGTHPPTPTGRRVVKRVSQAT